MPGEPDFKKGKRVVDRHAISDKMDAELACRSCGHTRRLEAHHLVNRSQGGDDVPENIVALCSACHHTYTHRGGKAAALVGMRIRSRMLLAEIMYIEKVKSLEWLDEHYPLVKSSARGAAETGIAPSSGGTDPAPENSEDAVGERGRSRVEDRVATGSVAGWVSGESSSEQDQAGAASAPSAGVEAPRPGRFLTHSTHQIGEPFADPEPPGPGKPCPVCKRRIPHEKKATSPTSAVFSHRGPLDTKDEYKEILEAACKHGGMGVEGKFWQHETILRMCAQVLAGPPGSLVMKP